MKRTMILATVLVLQFACAEGGPGAPGELSGEEMGSGFHLRWKDTTADELEFVVEQKAGSSAFAQLATVPFDTSQYMVENAQSLEEHRFRVRARLPGGLSDPSNEVAWMPMNVGPAHVTGGDAGANSDAGTTADAGTTPDAGVAPGDPSATPG